MTVRDELVGYVALQRLLDRKSALKKEMDTPPDALVELRSTFSGRREALGEKQLRREALAREQEGLQTEADALREEREHFRKQKSMVTNMKQLTAVVSELDHVETQLKAKDDRLLEILAEVERLDREIEELQRETPEEKVQREQAEAAWEARRGEASVELRKVESRMREVQRALGAESMARFKKLWASRRPSAVVPIEGWSCSSCHAELRPSLVQLVRTAEALQFCDSCRRLLYDPEQFPDDGA
ncbi:MAG: zinc ribbon domain-containing protein [Acidobacteriota bacterium]